MRKTAAQRYNDKADKIFETAKKNNAKYAPLHNFQTLTTAQQSAGSAVQAIQYLQSHTVNTFLSEHALELLEAQVKINQKLIRLLSLAEIESKEIK